MHERPDILAAEAQLHAATAGVGVATANLYPLFDHGELRARQRAAQAVMRAALANYQQVVLSAFRQVTFRQVTDALQGLDQDAALLASENHALSITTQNLALTRESYQVDNRGVLQVLDAERQNQRARLGLIGAQVQRYRDAMQLLLALGGRIPPAAGARLPGSPDGTFRGLRRTDDSSPHLPAQRHRGFDRSVIAPGRSFSKLQVGGVSNTTVAVLLATIDSSIMLIAMPAIFRGIKLDPLDPGNPFYLL